MEILGKLFGSDARVRLMRLFLLHSSDAFGIDTLKKRTKTNPALLRKETNTLLQAGFLKKKGALEETKTKKKKVPGFILNRDFAHLHALRALVLSPGSLHRDKLLGKFSSVGRLKFLSLAGIFLDTPEEGKVDVFLVADGLKRKVLERTLSLLESEIGKELSYAAMDTKEFLYRVSMYDRFIHDILENPHETLLDKLNIGQ